MNIGDLDLRLLRVFVAVVESHGIANAQTSLTKDASTISKQLKLLEDRLGLRLCVRGRAGFSLTPAGKLFYRQTTELLRSIKTFEQDARNLQGKLSGDIHLALIDNLVSDPSCPVVEILSRYGKRPENAVTLYLDVIEPAQIELRILEGKADLGIGIFPYHLGELEYRTLYTETDLLVCAPDHPLAQATSRSQARHLLAESAKVSRGFLRADDLQAIHGDLSTVTAWVSNVEAAAMLILAGTHVGFLPEHYARHWISTGELIPVLPEHYRRQSPIEAVLRRTHDEKLPAATALLEDLQAVTRSA